ncbi:hypothetical protein N0Y54_29910 [Nostoc punctiforme UO1]|uniref:hypothetical protein n=1 Tax=Nostoc punctiforme TaxID=272131 RepID=UPI00309FD5DF
MLKLIFAAGFYLEKVLMDIMAWVEVAGNEPTVRAFANFSKRNPSHIKGILNLTIPLDESPIWILGQYLEHLGLSTESWRPVEDGKRVSIIGSILRMSCLLNRYWSYNND